MMKKRILKNCAVYQMLKANGKKKHVSFHTPGHKEKGWDITELSYSDNLASPNGCIKQAEEDIARILGAYKSYILTDGSTAGVHAMLYALKKLGKKTIAITQNCHLSLYTGAELLGLTILPLTPTKENLEEVDALFITSPNYYGNIPDLKELKNLCKETNTLFLIDGAHGGHLHYSKTLYAGAYADMWVDGVHKSLPALTQGAIVSAKEEALARVLKEGVTAFQTTSPSYPIMASVEYAVKYPENKKLVQTVATLFEKDTRVTLQSDWTKLCVFFGENAFDAENFFIGKGIYPEFCDGENVLFYLSPATKIRDLKRLKKALDKAFAKYPYLKKETDYQIPAPSLFLKDVETEWVELEKSIGKICAVSCGLFPPCTPLIHAGEMIEENKITTLKKAKNAFGLKEGAICIVKEARQL